MTDDGIITNKMLLEHQQATRSEFNQRIDRFEKRVDARFQEIDRKLDEAKEQREGIKEDLEATIRMQAGHEYQLAVLTGRPMPEDY